MTNLPNKSHLTSGLTTEAQFQSAIGDLYDVISQLALIGPATEYTLDNTGVITPGKALIVVDTENDTAADDLNRIVPSTIGERVIILRSAADGRVVTVKHNQSGTGKILLTNNTDAVLADTSYCIALLWDATAAAWKELWRNFGVRISNPTEAAAIRALLELGTAAGLDVGTLSTQIPRNSDLGAASLLGVGTGAGQLPRNSDLGTLSKKSIVTNAEMDGSGIVPGTYNQIAVNAQGRAISGSNTPTIPPAASVGITQLKVGNSVQGIAASSLPALNGVNNWEQSPYTLLLSSAHSKQWFFGCPGGATGFESRISIPVHGATLGAALMVELSRWTQARTDNAGNYYWSPSYDQGRAVLWATNGAALSALNGCAIYALQSYMTASPPYDLGDGEVAGFIYACVDKDGKVTATYMSETPPWAYNGPTNIKADYIDPDSGKKYVKQTQPLTREQILNGDWPTVKLVEITNELKNADMNLIPHMFCHKKETDTIVLFDPMDPDVERLLALSNAGEDITKMILDGDFKIDNEGLRRAAPDGVLPVKFRF